MVSLLKRSVWLKILNIQKSDELILETSSEPSIQQNSLETSQDLPSIKQNLNLEEELLPKIGGRAGPIWSCPKKPPHPF